MAGVPLTQRIGDLVDAGVRAVVLRERDLPDSQRAVIAGELLEILENAGGRLIVSVGPETDIRAFPESVGVHLSADATVPRLSAGNPIGRSCHGLIDVLASSAEGVDYVTLSPIFATKSKPSYGPPLGAGTLREISHSTPLPVLALGGIDSTRVRGCVEAGAYGIAVMGAVMATSDPAAIAHGLLGALADTPWHRPRGI